MAALLPSSGDGSAGDCTIITRTSKDKSIDICGQHFYSDKYGWASKMGDGANSCGMFIKFLFEKCSVVEPSLECGPHFEAVFTDEHVNALIENADELKSGSNFLAGCIEFLQCIYPTEPFSNFGVKLYSSENYQDVLDNEQVKDVKFHMNSPNDRSSDLGELIEKLHRNPGRHILASMVNTLSICNQHADNYPDVKKCINKLEREYPMSSDLTRCFIEYVRFQAQGPREYVKQKIINYQEEQLRYLSIKMLEQEQVVVGPGYPLRLPFKHTKHADLAGNSITPDIVFGDVVVDFINVPSQVMVECKSPSRSKQWVYKHSNDWMESDEGDGNEVEACEDVSSLAEQIKTLTMKQKCVEYQISSPLLWQVFEELLGMVITCNYNRLRGKKKVFQSGVIVENDMVHAVILAMDFGVFRKLKISTSAKETLSQLKQYAKKKSSFCRLYVITPKYKFHEMGAVCKSCLNYFCNVY